MAQNPSRDNKRTMKIEQKYENIKIVEPNIFLIAKPKIDYNEFNKFICKNIKEILNEDLNDQEIIDKLKKKSLDIIKDSDQEDRHPDLIPEIAGRLCYQSYYNPRPGGNYEYLNNIKQKKHGSVLEHTNWTFLLHNISRSVSHELVRHRAGWSFSQLSQRYVLHFPLKVSICPGIYQYPAPVLDAILSTANECAKAYKKILDNLNENYSEKEISKSEVLNHNTDKIKLFRQISRSVLPNCTATSILITANTRALRHFFELRCNRHADFEIAWVANKMYDMVSEIAYSSFCDYKKITINDHLFELQTDYNKV